MANNGHWFIHFARAFLEIILASPFCENMSRWSRFLCSQPFSIFESIYRFIDFFHFFLFIKQNHKQNMRPGNFQFCLHINLNRFSNETNITYGMLFSSAFSSFDFYFESYSISDWIFFVWWTFETNIWQTFAGFIDGLV